MDKEPMFCFETSLKMLYWSMLVYRYGEVSSFLQPWTLQSVSQCGF